MKRKQDSEYERLRKRAQKGKASPNQQERLQALTEQRISAEKRDSLAQYLKTLLPGAAPVQQAVQPSQEQPEHARIDAALAAAERQGIIAIEDVDYPDAEKRCIVMGSSHSSILGDMRQDTMEAHYQLFVLLHLFSTYHVRHTLLVEGSARGDQPQEHLTICFEDARKALVKQQPLHAREVQEFFATHPQEFKECLQQMLRDGKHPTFFSLSAYPHIEGAHSPEIMKEIDCYFAMEPCQRQFVEKYKPATGMHDSPYAELRAGQWEIRINDQWHCPNDIVRDAQHALQACYALDRVSRIREEEVVAHFAQAPYNSMPLAWVGLAHVAPIRDACLAKKMAVRIVLPAAEQNTVIPKDIRHIAKQLSDFAQFYVRLNQGLPTTNTEELR